MIIRATIDVNAPPTEEQIKMLEEAEKMPIVFDEDCPELTPEELRQFRRVNGKRHPEDIERTVTLKLSPQAMNTVKKFGRNYISVLTDMLEAAIADSETVKQYL